MKVFISALTVLSLTGCGPFIEWERAEQGIRASEPLITAIEAYRSDNGIYPATLDELSLTDNVRNEAKARKITYVTWNNRNQYGVVFSMWGPPFNPHCSYGSNLNRWQCLGK